MVGVFAGTGVGGIVGGMSGATGDGWGKVMLNAGIAGFVTGVVGIGIGMVRVHVCGAQLLAAEAEAYAERLRVDEAYAEAPK